MKEQLMMPNEPLTARLRADMSRLSCEAADEIERLRELIREVIDGHWCVTDLQEAIGDA